MSKEQRIEIPLAADENGDLSECTFCGELKLETRCTEGDECKSACALTEKPLSEVETSEDSEELLAAFACLDSDGKCCQCARVDHDRVYPASELDALLPRTFELNAAGERVRVDGAS